MALVAIERIDDLATARAYSKACRISKQQRLLAADIPDVLATAAWKPRSLRVFGARIDGVPIGIGVLSRSGVEYIAIDERWQQLGHGKTLLIALVAQHPAKACVSSLNQAACCLFYSAGFKITCQSARKLYLSWTPVRTDLCEAPTHQTMAVPRYDGPMRLFHVAGSPGTGKSTLALELDVYLATNASAAVATSIYDTDSFIGREACLTIGSSSDPEAMRDRLFSDAFDSAIETARDCGSQAIVFCGCLTHASSVGAYYNLGRHGDIVGYVLEPPLEIHLEQYYERGLAEIKGAKTISKIRALQIASSGTIKDWRERESLHYDGGTYAIGCSASFILTELVRQLNCAIVQRES